MSTDPEILKLIEIARQELPDDKNKGLPPVKRFMVADGVEPGDEPIKATLVLDRYHKWCNLSKEKPISDKSFFQELALYAEKKSTGSGSFYKLSPKGFNLSPEYLALVNASKGNLSGTKKKKVKLR